ncbi:hypothetical protein GCM10022248_36740 [Nonomuraea soli]
MKPVEATSVTSATGSGQSGRRRLVDGDTGLVSVGELITLSTMHRVTYDARERVWDVIQA